MWQSEQRSPGDRGLRPREPGKRIDTRALQQVQATGLGTEWASGQMKRRSEQVQLSVLSNWMVAVTLETATLFCFCLL